MFCRRGSILYPVDIHSVASPKKTTKQGTTFRDSCLGNEGVYPAGQRRRAGISRRVGTVCEREGLYKRNADQLHLELCAY